jgi:hypothetical protein
MGKGHENLSLSIVKSRDTLAYLLVLRNTFSGFSVYEWDIM